MKFPGEEIIKQFFDAGFWTEAMVKSAVECENITPEQFEQITGKDYVA